MPELHRRALFKHFPYHACAGAASALGAEDGTGGVLSKSLLLLRLHFSYITEAVQEMAKKPVPAAAAAAPAASQPPPKPQVNA